MQTESCSPRTKHVAASPIPPTADVAADAVRQAQHPAIPAADGADAVQRARDACRQVAEIGVVSMEGSVRKRISGGQALGQKNTVLAIWMAYTYLNPLSSVGPGSYVLWQNIINSYQLWKKRKNETE